MSRDIFFVSDTHFGHTNAWEKFKQPDGVTPLRPFSSTEEMDEVMAQNWSKIVKPGDSIYHLGDVVINKKKIDIIKSLPGKKRLIGGNHDIFDDQVYRNVGFEKIKGCRVFVGDFICTHIPIHPESMARFRTNVHGHYHSNIVDDPNYMCVCVEHTSFGPIHYDEVKERIEFNRKFYADNGSAFHWQSGKSWKEINKGRLYTGAD